MDYIFVFLFAGTALALVSGGLLISRIIAPHRPGKVKGSPYECGEETIGYSWSHFNVGYYLFALLFLVFDVESAFLFPWAVVFREMGMTGFIEVLIFIFILLLALMYAWKKGVLKWK